MKHAKGLSVTIQAWEKARTRNVHRIQVLECCRPQRPLQHQLDDVRRLVVASKGRQVVHEASSNFSWDQERPALRSEAFILTKRAKRASKTGDRGTKEQFTGD